MFLGTGLPVPDLDGCVTKFTLGPYVDQYVVEGIDGHKLREEDPLQRMISSATLNSRTNLVS